MSGVRRIELLKDPSRVLKHVRPAVYRVLAEIELLKDPSRVLKHILADIQLLKRHY